MRKIRLLILVWIIVIIIVVINKNKEDESNYLTSEVQTSNTLNTLNTNFVNAELEVADNKIEDVTIDEITINNIGVINVNEAPVLHGYIKNNSENSVKDKMVKIQIFDKKEKQIDEIYAVIPGIDAGANVEWGVKINVTPDFVSNIKVTKIEMTHNYEFAE